MSVKLYVIPISHSAVSARLMLDYKRMSYETVRRHLGELPDLLHHADQLVEAGTIGASVPNAASFQIGPSLRLLMNFVQLEPLLSHRPAARFAKELLPDYPGRVPSVFPADWMPAHIRESSHV